MAQKPAALRNGLFRRPRNYRSLSVFQQHVRDDKKQLLPAVLWLGRCDKHRYARVSIRVSFPIRPLKTPEDCALAYADLLDNVGAGRLTPEEAQTISTIVAKRAELFPSIELAAEIEALKAQLAGVIGAPRPPTPIRRPFAASD